MFHESAILYMFALSWFYKLTYYVVPLCNIILVILVHTHTRTHARTHARTHTRTHAYTPHPVHSNALEISFF